MNQHPAKDPLDLCKCGDYRRDHKDGHGPCVFNHIPGGVHGGSQCLKFRLSRSAGEAGVHGNEGGTQMYEPTNEMTDADVVAELRSGSAMNKARAKFSSWSAKIEQAGQQRRPLSPIEMRRMEFQAVHEIAAALAAKD